MFCDFRLCRNRPIINVSQIIPLVYFIFVNMISEDKICRFCYNSYDEKDVKDIGEIENEILQVLCIKLNLDITENPVICQKCRISLEENFYFKSTCIYTEDFITPFIKSDSLVDMKSVCGEMIKSEPGINKNICRLCMHSTNEDFELSDEQKEQFRNFFPEINLNAANSSVLCSSCNQSQKKFFSFATLCLMREEKIQEYHKMLMSKKRQGRYIYMKKFQQYLRGQEEPEEEQYDFMVFSEELDIKPDEIDNDMFCREGIKKKFMCKFCSYSTDNITYLKKTHSLMHKSPIETESFVCPHCPLKTKYQSVLLKHIKTLHSDDLMYCANCDFSTKHKISLKRHVSIHQRQWHYCDKCKIYRTKDLEKLTNHVCKVKKVKRYQCNLCPATYSKPYSLKKHKQNKHYIGEPTEHKCDKCEFTSSYLKHIRKHAKIHEEGHNKTVYECILCNFVAFFSGKLKQHLIKKHDYKTDTFKSENFIKNKVVAEKNFQCDKCNFKSVRKSTLENHLKMHAGLLSYKCKLCPFETTTPKKLDSHQINHKESLYKCDLCPYRAKTKFRLNFHKIRHEKDPILYRCKICAFASRHKASYRTHLLEVHADRNAFKCDICDFETSTRTTMLRHKQYVHIAKDAPDLKCDKCDFTTKRRDSMRAHLQMVHPSNLKMYKCEQCSFGTKYMRSLRNHIRDIHNLKASNTLSKKTQKNDIYGCDKCPFRTTTIEYLKRHKKYKHFSGTKLYKCDLCSYETKRKPSLITHQIVHRDDVKMYTCNHCDFKSKYLKSLKNHVSNKHESWKIINQEDGFVMEPQSELPAKKKVY